MTDFKRNFIFASVIASLVSVMLIKIFNPEISTFTDKIRDSKPNKNIVIGELNK